jgi:hypothetical protein
MGRQFIAGHTFAFARTGDIQALNRARLSCGVVASKRRKLRRMVSSEPKPQRCDIRFTGSRDSDGSRRAHPKPLHGMAF